MTKLPTIEDRALPQAAPYIPQQVIVPDLSAEQRASTQLGQQIERTGSQIYDIIDRKQRFDYSLARSQFYNRVSDLETQLDQDAEVEKLPEKFKTGIEKIKEDLNKEQNPYITSRLNATISQYEKGALNKYNQLAITRGAALDAAKADETIDATMNQFLKTKDPVARFLMIKSAQELYADTIPDNKPDKPVLVATAKKRIAQRFQQAAFLQLPPSDQIRMLEQEKKDPESTIAGFIPPDEREELLVKAKINYENQQEEVLRAKERTNKINKLRVEDTLIEAADQGLSFDQLPPNVQMAASAEDIKRFNAIRNKKIGLGQALATKEEEKYYEYQNLYISNPKAFSEISPLDIAATIPVDKQSEVLGWHSKALQGVNAPASMQSYNSIVKNTLNSIGITDLKKPIAVKFQNRLTEEIKYFQETNKKDPNRYELKKMADDLVVEKAFEGKLWGSNKERVFKMPKEAKPIIEVPDKVIQEIQLKAIDNGDRVPSEDEIREWYSKKQNQELSYVLPNSVSGPEEIQRLINEDMENKPQYYQGLDSKEESEKIYKRYYRDGNLTV